MLLIMAHGQQSRLMNGSVLKQLLPLGHERILDRTLRLVGDRQVTVIGPPTLDVSGCTVCSTPDPGENLVAGIDRCRALWEKTKTTTVFLLGDVVFSQATLAKILACNRLAVFGRRGANSFTGKAYGELYALVVPFDDKRIVSQYVVDLQRDATKAGRLWDLLERLGDVLVEVADFTDDIDTDDDVKNILPKLRQLVSTETGVTSMVTTGPSTSREFWKIATDFPPDKESVYPDHTMAQEFATVTNKTVLEYGCGGGSDTVSYLKRGNKVIYADIVSSNVEVTKTRCETLGYGKRAMGFALADSAKLSLPAGSVDVVNCHGVLHHISDEKVVDAILKEFRRMIRPTGKLYAMLYTEHLWMQYKPGALDLCNRMGLAPWQAFGWLTDGEGCPWARPYTEDEGKELLAKNGWKVISTYVYNGTDFRTFRAVPA